MLVVPNYVPLEKEADWEKIFALHPGVMVMTGDNSGPGTNISGKLAENIHRAKDLGWKLAGYVFLDNLKRPLIEITSDITVWRYWYPLVDGIFFDGCPPPGTGVLEALLALESMATRLGGVCIFNPGVKVDQRWYQVLKKAYIVEQENYASAFVSQVPIHARSVWLAHHAPSEQWRFPVPVAENLYKCVGTWHDPYNPKSV